MDWDKLRIFHAVADAGSFTHAGHDLGLSQSAVSRQISALEQDLKVPLFHRHARGLILTEQGEVLYRTAHDVFAKLAAAQHAADGFEGQADRRAAGSPPRSASVRSGSRPRIAEFLELYPQISVTMLLDDRELDLAMREADVAIRLRRPIQPDLIQRKLFTVHYHVYASPEYLRRRGTPKALDDLEQHSILSFGVSPPYLSDVNLLETAGRREGSPRRSVLRVNNVYGLYKAVEAHLGIATLPDYLVERESGLVQVDLPLEAPAFDTYFVYPEELKESKRVAVFRDFIVSKAKEWKY